MNLLRVGLVLLFLNVACLSFGAEIYLQNGDRITGEIIEQSDTQIRIATKAMGEIVVDAKYVKPKEEPKPQAVVEESPWDRSISFGYNQTGGNTQKSGANMVLKANRKTDDDEWSFEHRSSYTSSDKKMDSKKFYGMGRYANNFGRDNKKYVFYKVEGDQDRFANIDYRFIPSVGYGYWFYDEDDFKLLAETAVGYQYTNYRDDTKSSGEAVIIPRAYLEKVLMHDLKLTQDLVLYPSLDDMEALRFHSDTSLVYALKDGLSLKFSFIDDYNSMPSGSSKKNDYQLVTMLEYAF